MTTATFAAAFGDALPLPHRTITHCTTQHACRVGIPSNTREDNVVQQRLPAKEEGRKGREADGGVGRLILVIFCCHNHALLSSNSVMLLLTPYLEPSRTVLSGGTLLLTIPFDGGQRGLDGGVGGLQVWEVAGGRERPHATGTNPPADRQPRATLSPTMAYHSAIRRFEDGHKRVRFDK